jgi:outer membrane protein assembly factor BamB
VRRRQVLAAGALALSTGVAGCSERTPPPAEPFDRPTDRWPSPGYDPANTGHAPTAPGPGEERWRTNRRATDPPLFGVLSTPVVDDHVYVAGLAGPFFRPDRAREHTLALAALDRTTGESVWTLGFDGGLSGAPVLVGSTLVVGGYDGDLHGIATTGQRRWRVELDGRSGTPTPYGDRVYVADGDGSLHAVSAGGERLWRARREGLVDRLGERLLGDDDSLSVGSPAADERGVYTTVASSSQAGEGVVLLAYDHAGDQRWRRYFEDAAARQVRGPTVADGTVYAVVGDTVVALDAADGGERWRFVTGYETPGPPATDGDRLYVGAKNLYALDPATGTERWRVVNEAVRSDRSWRRGLPYVARPVVADGAVHLRAGAFDAATGQRLWGDDADAWLSEGNYVDEEFAYRPSVRLALTADARYLTHAHHGVVRLG